MIDLGKPIAYPRSRISNKTGRPISPARYRQWLNDARMRIIAVRAGQPQLTDEVVAEVIVRPGSISIDLTPAVPSRPKGIRGDLDNYVKAALDACQAANLAGGGRSANSWILDDRQVVAIEARFGE